MGNTHRKQGTALRAEDDNHYDKTRLSELVTKVDRLNAVVGFLSSPDSTEVIRFETVIALPRPLPPVPGKKNAAKKKDSKKKKETELKKTSVFPDHFIHPYTASCVTITAVGPIPIKDNHFPTLKTRKDTPNQAHAQSDNTKSANKHPMTIQPQPQSQLRPSPNLDQGREDLESRSESVSVSGVDSASVSGSLKEALNDKEKKTASASTTTFDENGIAKESLEEFLGSDIDTKKRRAISADHIEVPVVYAETATSFPTTNPTRIERPSLPKESFADFQFRKRVEIFGAASTRKPTERTKLEVMSEGSVLVVVRISRNPHSENKTSTARSKQGVNVEEKVMGRCEFEKMCNLLESRLSSPRGEMVRVDSGDEFELVDHDVCNENSEVFARIVSFVSKCVYYGSRYQPLSAIRLNTDNVGYIQKQMEDALEATMAPHISTPKKHSEQVTVARKH
ncbi:hypothetical protein AAMO2058_001646900 [Amorphochlora amoebiformis]